MSDLVFGLVSGVAWGVVVQLSFSALAGGWHVSPTFWPFVSIGAAVGVLTTRALRSVSLDGGLRIALVSLGSLVCATAAFGCMLSLAGLLVARMSGLHQPSLFLGPLLAPVYWVWGLFATGLVVGLWPLSVVNHWALARLRTRRLLAG